MIDAGPWPNCICGMAKTSAKDVSGTLKAGKPPEETMKIEKRPIIVEAELVEEAQKVETPAGTVTAWPGDYIITGVNGETYPISPDVMKESYKPAGPEAIEHWENQGWPYAVRNSSSFEGP